MKGRPEETVSARFIDKVLSQEVVYIAVNERGSEGR